MADQNGVWASREQATSRGCREQGEQEESKWGSRGHTGTSESHLCDVLILGTCKVVAWPNEVLQGVVRCLTHRCVDRGENVTLSDYLYAYFTQIIIGTALFLYLDPFIRCRLLSLYFYIMIPVIIV